MPELPEAETIAGDLRSRVVGHTINGLDVPFPDVLAPGLGPERLRRELDGRRIVAVGRRGKNVVLGVSGGLVLVVNLGMTGRLVASEAGRVRELRHVAVRFELDNGRVLLYDDSRRFGRIELLTEEGWATASARLGLEPLNDEFTATALHGQTAASRTPIRNWLLDQRRVAGIGNIYANEALFRARIHPARPANSVTREEAVRLRDELRAVLHEAIAARGTTFSDFRDGAGEKGGFEPRLQVYGREDRPCPRCGETISRFSLSNRSVFYCPACQPESGLTRPRAGAQGGPAPPRR